MRLKLPQFLVALLMVGALILGGCSGQQGVSKASDPASTATLQATETSSKTTTEATSVSETKSESIPGMKDLPRLEGTATVVSGHFE